MARAVEVNSHVWAKKLTVITGSNQVQADNHQATPIPTTEAAPTVALDVSQLGGMYAEHIFIVGTEAGVGSRQAGKLMATAGSLVVNNDGWLTHTGLAVARENVNLQAQQALTLQGEVKSGGAQSYQGSTLEGMGVTLKGQSLTLQATQGALQLPGATLESQQILTLTTPTVLNTEAATLRAEKLQLSARDLSNIGGNLVQHDPEDLPLKVTGTLDNSNGRIASNSHQLTLQAQTVNNQDGRIEHAGQGELQIEAQTLLGQRGHFGSNGAVVLRAAQAELQQATTQGKVTLNGEPWQPTHEALATLGNQSLQPYPTALRERVSTLPLALTLPTSGLFSVNTQPGVPLVSTDPRFIQQRQYASSEQLLKALKLDLQNLPKRFGDGFYEQQQLRDAVIQMSGRRFIRDYQDDDSQYRALLGNALSAAKMLNLQPGVSLSKSQMAQLTRDIVWPVQTVVQAPEGHQVQIWAPQLYLRLPEGTIGAGSGSLISAKNIALDLSGDLTGNGTILAHDSLAITAENIHHHGGMIYGRETRLKACQDLNHQGGLLGGGSLLQVQAERDVTAQTETLTATCGNADSGQNYSSRTNLGTRARLLVTEPGGIMAVHAGRNADLVAAQVLNAGEGGHTQIRAGHDLKLSTAQVGQHDQLIWDENNHRVEGGYRDVGSQIKTVGTLQLHAGNKIIATAAQVASGVSAQSVAALVQGPLALEQEGSGAAPLVSTEQSLEAQLTAGTLQMSAKSIDILPGQATRYLDEAHQKTHSGLFNDKTTTSRIVQQQTIALGSQFIGTQTEMVATEGELQIKGSTVLGEQGTTLIAQEGNIKITSAENRQRQISTHQVEESGLLTGGGATLTLGERERTQQQQLEGTQQQSSAVGSLLGDVRIWAKQGFQQLGSHLITPQGDINVSAATVEVLDTHHQQQLSQESSSYSSGLTLGVTNPALSAAQTALQLESAASQTDDPRMQALAAAAGGLAAKNSYDAIKTNPQQLGGVNASLSVGQSESHSESRQSHSTAQRSQIVGRNITLQARSGDATIQGDVQAEKQTQITATGQLKLLASENRSQQQSEQSSSSSSIGVGIGTNSGPAVTVSVSMAKGSSRGESCSYSKIIGI